MQFLSKAQIDRILDAYETRGSQAAGEVVPGISPQYVRTLAFRHKVRAKRQPAKVKPTRADRAWARARKVGAICA